MPSILAVPKSEPSGEKRLQKTFEEKVFPYSAAALLGTNRLRKAHLADLARRPVPPMGR